MFLLLVLYEQEYEELASIIYYPQRNIKRKLNYDN